MEKQNGNVVFYQPYKYSSLTGLQGKLNFKLRTFLIYLVLACERTRNEEGKIKNDLNELLRLYC